MNPRQKAIKMQENMFHWCWYTNQLNLPPALGSIRCPFELAPLTCLLSSPSAIMELALLAMFVMVLGELNAIPLAKLSWYSGKEWGWKLGIPWLAYFISSIEWLGSRRLNFWPIGATLAGEAKLIGTVELRWGSTNVLTGDWITECNTWLDALSMPPDAITPVESQDEPRCMKEQKYFLRNNSL